MAVSNSERIGSTLTYFCERLRM